MTTWLFEYDVLGTDQDISINSRNVTGTPLTSAALIAERAAGYADPVCGVYRFTCYSYVGGGTAGFTCAAAHPHDAGNPMVPSGNLTLWVGATPNVGTIPGVTFLISSGLQTGDVFEIGIGCYYSTTLGGWVRPVSFGPALAGEETSARLITVKNDSGSTMTSSYLVATNAARVENSENYQRPFLSFRQTGVLNPTADADLTGQAITFANVGSGVCDILVDGNPIDCYCVTEVTTYTDGEDLKMDGLTVYRFADGTALQSIEFVLSDSLTASDTATIYVSDGGACVELATTIGTWVSGPTGLDVTESGQATGVVTDGGSMDFYIRAAPGAAKDDSLNPRSYSLRVEGVEL